MDIAMKSDFLDQMEKRLKDQWKKLEKDAQKQLSKNSRMARKGDTDGMIRAERNSEVITRGLKMAERGFDSMLAQIDDLKWSLRPAKKTKKAKKAKKKAEKH